MSLPTNPNDVIPVRYFGATGGQFLTSWLTQAKLGKTKDLPLSKHGNSHDGFREYQFIERALEHPKEQYNLRIMDGHRIEYWWRKEKITTVTPYFIASEVADLPSLLAQYPRVVNITFDLDDIEAMARIWIAKWAVDENRSARLLMGNYDEVKNNAAYIWEKRCEYTQNAHQYFDTANPDSRALSISWKQLYQGTDDTDLIQRLSDYTGVAKENFQTKDLVRWRTLSQTGYTLFTDEYAIPQ